MVENDDERGDMLVSSTQMQGDLQMYFISWKDKKPVNVLTSFPTSRDYCTQNSKNRLSQQYERINIPRPFAIAHY